jgi:1-acyl-sn-glycerol-3-phosphate acyltransferase
MKATLNLTKGTPPRSGTTMPGEVGVQTGDARRAGLPIKLFRALLRLLFKLVFRVRIEGLGNLPQGQAIFCANHLGWTDPFLVLLYLPLEPRVYVLGEREVAHISRFRNRMLAWLRVMVPLDRGNPRAALDTVGGVLSRGGSVLVFPEGSLGKEEGVLLPLKAGSAHIAAHSGYPLVPVGLTGTSELWVGRHLHLRIGTPIDPSEYEGDARDKARAMTPVLESQMRALLPGDRQHARFKPLRRWLTNLL